MNVDLYSMNVLNMFKFNVKVRYTSNKVRYKVKGEQKWQVVCRNLIKVIFQYQGTVGIICHTGNTNNLYDNKDDILGRR